MLFRRTVLAGLTALILSPLAATAAELPDLKGKTVVVVTENAYPPLRFVDPKTGKQIGWEYDAMNEIAKRLNFGSVRNTSWDAMIQAIVSDQSVQCRHDRDHHQGRPQDQGRLLRSLHALAAVPCWCAATDALCRAQDLRRLQRRPRRRAARHLALLCRRHGSRQQRQNPRIKLFETFGATVQALKAGDVDVVLTDSVAAQGYVDASNGGLKVIGGPLGTEDFGFIFPKGSDLVGPVNAAIMT